MADATGSSVPDFAAPVDIGHDFKVSEKCEGVHSVHASEPTFAHPRKRLVKSAVLPSPASHALLYSPATCRIVAGVIENSLAEQIDERLAQGWQLQHLQEGGKWERIVPVSEPIGNFFRAMKTMREIDRVHTPAVFAKDWKGKIGAVIDLSKDKPVYDPQGLREGSIEYYKIPTTSKQPPTDEEVKAFIELVDSISMEVNNSEALIAVHCHYGFNRTGYFMICYFIERRGWRLQDAVEEFAQKRPGGINHQHFIDALSVRYAIGLKKAPTA
ncbi:MAG: hypothetical protein M1820_007539 [Bogoriella megaspora]|nr:MAG: hypothetical protein M1820_007539 [Bogoriella megaspora]